MGRMVDQTGLNERLQQHARRSGMLVGVSMAVTIGLMIGAFVWIFFRIDPYFSDFTGRTGVQPASPVAARVVASPRVLGTPNASPPVAPTSGPGALPVPPTPTALPPASPVTAATPAFVATHVILDYGQPVNLRAGPSTSSARVALLSPGTRLKYLNEENHSTEVIWMRFETERGDVGWIRQVDVAPVR